jgi:nicotinic acid mononucleotide adenylyltransferase
VNHPLRRLATRTIPDVAVACYPGTFDPPTVAHLAVAEAARRACAVERVELVLNPDPIGKATARPFSERLASLQAVTAGHPWLSVAATEGRLVADVAAGYDVVVLGADKWAQVLDPSYHPSREAWQASLRRLPRVAVARRGDLAIQDEPLPGLRLDVVVLDVDLADVSSSEVRAGREEWRWMPA